MDKVTFIEVQTLEGLQTHAIIDRGNDEFTSMLKSTYDAQQEAIANYVPPTLPEAPTE